MDAKPLHAFFLHPDGSWYRLWITHTEPKTERGHAWHVHATFDKSGTIAPLQDTLWYEQPYGMKNWDFDDAAAAHAAFKERSQERLEHGYERSEATPPES